LRTAPALLLLALVPWVWLSLACALDRSGPGLYRSYCRRCHGAEGQGPDRDVKLYPYLNLHRSPMILRQDRAAVRQRIVEGHGPMPGFRRRLNPEELERLIDFTLRLSHTKSKE
jgi:mono/diheme cytochrome c family protein